MIQTSINKYICFLEEVVTPRYWRVYDLNYKCFVHEYMCSERLSALSQKTSRHERSHTLSCVHWPYFVEEHLEGTEHLAEFMRVHIRVQWSVWIHVQAAETTKHCQYQTAHSWRSILHGAESMTSPKSGVYFWHTPSNDVILRHDKDDSRYSWAT